MAVRFTPAGQDFRRTASLPSQSLFSACGFCTMNADTNAIAVLFGIESATTNAPVYYSLETQGDGTTLQYLDSAANTVNLGAITVGTPFFWGITKNGTAVRVFFRNLTTNVVTVTTGTGATTAANVIMAIGGSSYAGEDLNGRMSGVKIWDAVLSDAEMANESTCLRPMRSAGLHLFSPMIHSTVADCALDFSGNARDWTITGSPTQEHGQPVPWGSQSPTIGIQTQNLQFRYPDADITARAGAAWEPEGGPGTFFDVLDEPVPNDPDYDACIVPGVHTFEVGTGNASDPASSSGHVVRYRIAADSGDIKVSLKQGANIIATWTHNAVAATLTTYAQTLTANQADAITDYTDLSLSFTVANQ